MIAYFLLFAVWVVFSGLDNRFRGPIEATQSRTFANLAGATLLLLMVMRAPSVGTDLQGYQWQYEAQYARPEEPGYSFLVNLCRGLDLSFQAFLGVNALIVVLAVWALVRAFSLSALMSFYLHVTTGFFAMSMSGLRQSLAVAFTIFAFLALRKRHGWVPFGVLVWVACTFHNSAAVFAVVVLLGLRIRLSKRSIGLIFILSLLALGMAKSFPSLWQSLVGRFAIYLGGDQVSMNPLTIVVAAVVFFGSWLIWDERHDELAALEPPGHEVVPRLLVMAMLNLWVLTAAWFTGVLIITRLSYYFIPYAIVLIPRVIYTSKNPFARRFGPVLVFAMATAQFIVVTPKSSLGIGTYVPVWDVG